VSTTERVPFRVEIDRVVELLAGKIYQSPLALLRENCQNAYDAILQRIYLKQQFDPKISVEISSEEIIVTDNGIGMTKAEMINNYWHAGASGKNTPEARAAGVVGTFGIGAMANFGIAVELFVESESARTSERTAASALKASLSLTDDCIQLTTEQSQGRPGTNVRAVIEPTNAVDIPAAARYVKDCVRHLSVPVYLNGELVSQQPFDVALPKAPVDAFQSLVQGISIGAQFVVDMNIAVARTGDVWLSVDNIREWGNSVEGVLLLRQNGHQIHAFRSRFALAQAAVGSQFAFGGIANLPVLQPTAGREALTASSLQTLQTIITECDKVASQVVAHTEMANQNTAFMEWAYQHGRTELLTKLQIRVEPGDRTLGLSEIRDQSGFRVFNFFDGSDPALIKQFATEDNPLIVLSTRQPRRKCELRFLQKYCKVKAVENNPTVLSRKPDRQLSLAESALALRTISVLESDYFVPASVQFGKISHGLTILVDASAKPVDIVLDPEGPSIANVLRLYDTDFLSMTGLVKDFVRTAIFPKVAHLVPSSTRQGAEAFLRLIRKPRDLFEYEKEDLGSLSDLWRDAVEGRITVSEAARQSQSIVRTSIQVIDSSATRTVSSVIPDVLENEKLLSEVSQSRENQQFEALPAITRLEQESPAKLLVIGDSEPALKGYRCFLAVTERVRTERGEFFLQPHRTEIVWGGQKALYIFQHHSGEFGLYYELQGKDILSESPGGQSFATCTVVIKNQIYIPIPDEISAQFIPTGSGKKSFEVRCELLFPETGSSNPIVATQ
jgi:molecular chaperone HtpG